MRFLPAHFKILVLRHEDDSHDLLEAISSHIGKWCSSYRSCFRYVCILFPSYRRNIVRLLPGKISDYRLFVAHLLSWEYYSGVDGDTWRHW